MTVLPGPVAGWGGGRAVVMAVLNVTPDSFSDGGRWLDTSAAVKRGRDLVDAGADLVDVGGESTRPGASRVDAREEQRRVLPVIRSLTAAGIAVSIDTMNAATASAALEVGARLVNDVSGGQSDPGMLDVVAAAEVPFVVMHWRGHADRMGALAVYDDVVPDVRRELLDRVAAALAAGVRPERVVLDPGLGFAKDAAHNWALLAHLDLLCAEGYPVLVGASRKRFLGSLLGPPGAPRPPEQRDDATAALTALSAAAGAWGVRVHEPRASRDAVEVVAALTRLRGAP